MISVTPTSRSRTWLYKLDVRGAPITVRDYSDHQIDPERVEIGYLSINGGKPRMSSVRLYGNRVGGKVDAGPWGAMRLSAEWHEPERVPSWIRPLIEEYRPR